MQLENNTITIPQNTTLRGAINSGGVEGQTKVQYDPINGATSAVIYKCPDQGTATNIALQCQQLGYPYELDGGAIPTIQVHYPVDMLTNGLLNEPTPIVKWELTWQQVNQDIYEAKDRYFIGQLLWDDIQNIDNLLRTSNITQASFASSINATSATIAYNLKKIGVGERYLFTPVLKRIVIASNNWLANNNNIVGLGLTNTNLLQIFTTAELINTYSNTVSNALSRVPLSIQSQIQPQVLPGRFVTYYDVLTNKHIADTSLTSGMVWDWSTLIATKTGWLQYPVDDSMISPLKQQLTQTWVYNRWSCDGDIASPTSQTQGLYDSFSGLNSNGPFNSNLQVVV
jgi:hypothetical protein